VLLGGFAQLGLRVSERWTLAPELSLHRTVFGDVPLDGTMTQLALGVRWTP
jgi:hypothetical protein